MHSKYARTKLYLHHGLTVPEIVLKQIIKDIEHDNVFALTDDDSQDAFVFFPKERVVRHVPDKEVFTYGKDDEFVDSISQALYSYKSYLKRDTVAKNLIISP